MKRIAVQDDLSSVRSLLENHGYKILPLDGSILDQVDAVILHGQDDTVLGDETIRVHVPIINAESMTPQEVLRLLEEAGSTALGPNLEQHPVMLGLRGTSQCTCIDISHIQDQGEPGVFKKPT